MSKYEPVIGLEIHIQLNTKSKMFCSSPNQTEGVEPNTNICEVCSGQPGAMPVTNSEAVEKAIMLGLALGCEIGEYSKFDRKNYFYPDLPKGYQISQFDKPVCGRGSFEFEAEGQSRTIGITRAHLEEDAGKLVHPAGANYSLVDLNRAGVPLVEIVTEPDFKTPGEARVFLQELRRLARYLGISDADMEKGHLRCDANISLRKVGEQGLPNYKIEVKNMNSFRSVEEALIYEIARQEEELEDGKVLKNQTRGWQDDKKKTSGQREKEGSDDYRYFPEPDLPVLHFTQDFIERIRAKMPETPKQRRARFSQEFQLPEKITEQLIANKALSEYYEAVVSELASWAEAEKLAGDGVLLELSKEAANWIIGVFTEMLNTDGLSAGESKITPENFAELIKMIQKSEVSKSAAKQVFAKMYATGGDPSNILSDLGLKQISNEGELTSIVERLIADNPSVVADFKSGKGRALGFLVGKAMAETKGKANPKLLNDLFQQKIK